MELSAIERLIGALAVIGVVLFLLQSLARAMLRVRRRGDDGRIVAVLETTMLSNVASLHVVRIAEAYVVIGRSGDSLTKISEVSAASIDSWRGAIASETLRERERVEPHTEDRTGS